MKLSSSFLTSILASFCIMMAYTEDVPPVNPPCAICGCSFCPDGFTVGNPAGVIPVPPEFADAAPPGLTEVPCSLLDFAGTSGQIPEDLCNDDLRLIPEFREICGCPPLPTDAPIPAPTNAPVEAPVAAPTEAPVEAPVVAPTDAPVDAPVATPTNAPVDAPVVTPTNAPVDAPVVTPTNAPVDAPVPAPSPVVAPTPVVVPTRPIDKGERPRHYVDEVYHLSHPISSSYSSSATAIGDSWATVTEVNDGVGPAGFMHEYCSKTLAEYWYCTGTFVDLYYELKHKERRQFYGHVSFSGWFSDATMDGVFTITGGTEDFRGAKGHVYVCHVGDTTERELQVYY